MCQALFNKLDKYAWQASSEQPYQVGVVSRFHFTDEYIGPKRSSIFQKVIGGIHIR